MTDGVLISMRGIQRFYRMGEHVVRALDGIDLEIGRGEFVVLMGSSGSGKSTLMHLLGCLDAPSAGRVFLGGEDVAGLPDGRLSQVRGRRVGLVFQQFNLLNDLSVLENIALGMLYSGVHRGTRLERARLYAERLGLGDRLTHRPSQLSGGQAQRVAIARALANEPDIILADEPTGNLDSRTGAEIMEVLYDLHRRGYTIIMVTHDPRYAREGTRRIVLQDGRIVEDAPGRRPVSVVDAALPGHPERRGRGMRPWDLLRVGIREGLLAHKMRTALTMLGIIIAVAGVIAMSSFSLGSKRKQADQIRALGANLMRVVDARLEGEKLSAARVGGSPGLSLADLELLRRDVPGIARSAAAREIRLNVVAESARPLAPRILGVQGDYLEVNNLALAEGRFIDAWDQEGNARVAVLGHALAERLGTGSPIGHELILGGNPYRVIGRLANRNLDIQGLEATGATDANYDLLIPLRTLLNRTRVFDMRSQIDEIQLQLEDEDTLMAAGVAVRRLLHVAHGGQEDFQLVVPLDLLKQKQQAQKLLDVLTFCVSSVALVVGGIGIMNIMLASVRERIREIGIRRAVGATRRDILLQFLTEAIVIAVTGGVVGIALAVAVVAGTCLAFELPIVVSPVMILVSVLASTATGLLFGLYPAAQAAAERPVEALRYE
ncbi:MAG: ABC transporter permease [Lentisphaeria bacterium]|nr:ABC transporter permease [Lentisphaeria bacterium]